MNNAHDNKNVMDSLMMKHHNGGTLEVARNVDTENHERRSFAFDPSMMPQGTLEVGFDGSVRHLGVVTHNHSSFSSRERRNLGSACR